MDGLPKLDRGALRVELLAEFDEVLQRVADAVDEAATGRVIRDSEELARQALDEFRRKVYQRTLQQKIDAAEDACSPPISPTNQRPLRNKGRQPYTMQTVNGKIKLQRTRWHSPQDGGLTPTDAWLDEAEATISLGVREMACRLNQGSTSFQATADNLRHTARIDVSKETLRQLIESEGKAVARAMQQAELEPDWTAEDCQTDQETSRVYLGCDGVKVPLVTDDEKKKRRQKVRQKRQRRGGRCQPLPRAKAGSDNAYKEFRVGYLYDQTKTRRYVNVTAGNHEVAGRMLRRMSEQVHWSRAEETIANIDGAPWIRNQIEFHGLTGNIGLDFYHLRDYAQKTRRAVFGEDGESAEAGQDWLNETMHTFRHDGFDVGLEQLTDWRRGLRGKKRQSANALLGYVAERSSMIRYPEFRSLGWDIGSGPTESECKTTTHRVKGRGRRWDAANAEAMMSLAALQDSQLWNKYWLNADTARN